MGQRLSQEREPRVQAECAFKVFTPLCCVVLDKPLPSLSPVSNCKISLMNCFVRGIGNGRWYHYQVSPADCSTWRVQHLAVPCPCVWDVRFGAQQRDVPSQEMRPPREWRYSRAGLTSSL